MKKVFLLCGFFALLSTTIDAQIWRIQGEDCIGTVKEKYSDGDYFTIDHNGKTKTFKVSFGKGSVDMIPVNIVPAGKTNYDLKIGNGGVSPKDARTAAKLKTNFDARTPSSKANPRAGQSMGNLSFSNEEMVGGKKVILTSCSNFADLKGAGKRVKAKGKW